MSSAGKGEMITSKKKRTLNTCLRLYYISEHVMKHALITDRARS